MNPQLTPDVLAELRTQLEQMRARLTTDIVSKRRGEGALDTPEQNPDMEVRGDLGDQSVDLEGWDTSRQEALNLEAQLAEVEHALEKFDLGTYGICEGCDRPIPLARLRIIPETRYDVEHQEQVDASQRRA